MVTQRSFPQTAAKNWTTFLSVHSVNPTSASMMRAKFTVRWLLQSQPCFYGCPTWDWQEENQETTLALEDTLDQASSYSLQNFCGDTCNKWSSESSNSIIRFARVWINILQSSYQSKQCKEHIHQKKYIIKYTIQKITNLIHESRLKPSSLNIFQFLKRREGEGWFMAMCFQDIPWPTVLG